MATVSGKDGDLSLDAEIEKVLSWNISYSIEQHGAAHSDSEGWKEHTGGIKEWSGSAILHLGKYRYACRYRNGFCRHGIYRLGIQRQR